MDSRRSFLARAATLGLVYGTGRSAFAQGGGLGYRPPSPGEMEDLYGPEVEIPQDLADWFENLKRPDVAAGTPHSKNDQWNTAVSCCSAGDGYPIEILEDATPPHGGRVENGIARVTDTSKRQMIIPARNPDGSTYRQTKMRYELKSFAPEIAAPEYGKLAFRFSSDRVTRERDGNPTKTAWVFVRVIQDGYVNFVYCVVPLPPSM